MPKDIDQLHNLRVLFSVSRSSIFLVLSVNPKSFSFKIPSELIISTTPTDSWITTI